MLFDIFLGLLEPRRTYTWSDPTCNAEMSVSMDIDLLGSFGKLYMRYRTVFAAFPLVVVTLVLRKQFKIYDATGSFITSIAVRYLC